MPDSATDKLRLRNELRAQRRALDAEMRRLAAESVCEQVAAIPDWGRMQRIALYLASDGELDPCILTQRASQAGLEIYLPQIDAKGEMHFAQWRAERPLVRNRYDIGQPDADTPRIAPGRLDCIFLPLVAWTAGGARLGMGGGYYDRALSNSGGALLVGLGYEFQRRASLPEEDWDVPVHYVATESALYDCRGSRGAEGLTP